MWFHRPDTPLEPACVRWKVHPDFSTSPSHLEFIRLITRRAVAPKLHLAVVLSSDCNCPSTAPGREIHYIELTLPEWNDLMRWHARIRVPIVPAGMCHCRRVAHGLGAIKKKELDVLDWYYPLAASAAFGRDPDGDAAAADGLREMLKEAMETAAMLQDDFEPIRQIYCCFEDGPGQLEHGAHLKGLRGHLGMLRRHTH